MRLRRAVLALTTALLAVPALPATAGAAPAAASVPTANATRLAVQVTGSFQDSSDAAVRPARTTLVVGSVATSRLQFSAPGSTDRVSAGQSFRFTVTCATQAGGECSPGTVLRWDFGDGQLATSTVGQPNAGDITPLGNTTAASALTYYHSYTAPGAFSVKVSADDKARPAYGAGGLRALVGPRFADVDAAYTATRADGSTYGKGVNPASESVWAVSALGLMPSCPTLYTATSSLPVDGASPTDTGRAQFCTEPTRSATAERARGMLSPATNPMPASQNASRTWSEPAASYADTSDCLAYAGNCGLPVSAFASAGAPQGSPLASCTGTCLDRLVAKQLLSDASSPKLAYDPSRCADNVAASVAASGALTLVPGVEPGCQSRGDFLRALLAAVDGDGTNAVSDGAGAALDTTSCSPASAPAADGRDGVRRASALLRQAGSAISPCWPAAALTKGEAYRMLSALLPGGTGSAVALPDLDDRALGRGPRVEAYPYAAAVRKVLAAGAPLVGSSTCPVPVSGQVCFNADEALTRLDAAQLLAFFALGDTSDVAALQVALTADSVRTTIGGNVQVRLSISVPPWMLPYATSWQLGVGDGVPASAASFACSRTGSRTLTTSTFVLPCSVTVNTRPTSGVVPIVASVGGRKYPALQLQVVNTPPKIVSVTSPTFAEDATGTGQVSTNDTEGNPLTRIEVAPAATGPWSDLATTALGSVRVTALDGALGAATLKFEGAPDANGSMAYFVRACDSDADTDCSPGQAAPPAVITPVNDAPDAYPVSNVLRSDNVVAVTGDCRTAQSASTLPANVFALRGSDPRDGRGSETIGSYTLYAPPGGSTARPGSLYVCTGSTWSQVTSETGTATSNARVLWNPTPGQYGEWPDLATSFGFAVTDTGEPAPGRISSKVAIGLANTQPGVAPVARLSASPLEGATFTTDFVLSGAASTDSGSTAGIVSYAYDFGDGATTSGIASSATHRYTSPGTYTVKVTVTDKEGLTDTATASLTVAANLVGNPTFESGAAQWTSVSGTDIVTGTSAHGGQRGLDVTRRSGTGCTIGHLSPSLERATSVGTTYRASIWVKASAASDGASVTMRLREDAPDGTGVGSLATTSTIGTQWKLLTVSYTAAGTGNSLNLTLSLPSFAQSACFTADDATITSSSAGTFRDLVMADSPVAFYPLDEVAGTTAENLTNSPSGTYLAPVTLGLPPVAATGSRAAFRVDGSNSGVAVTGMPVATAVGARNTVEMWVDVPAAANGMFFSSGSVDVIVSGGLFGFNTGQGDVYGTSSSVIRGGRHHLVAVFANGSVPDGRIYVDGVELALSQMQGTPAVRSLAATGRIGGWSSGNGLVGGVLDEVAVYNRELSAASVAAHYAAGR